MFCGRTYRILAVLAVSFTTPFVLPTSHALAALTPTADVYWPPVEDRVPFLIVEAAQRHGVDPVRALRIAQCESSMGSNPAAYWPLRLHRGVFQWDAGSWAERAPLAGVSPEWDRAFDDWSNVEVSAVAMRDGQWWRWTCR